VCSSVGTELRSICPCGIFMAHEKLTFTGHTASPFKLHEKYLLNLYHEIIFVLLSSVHAVSVRLSTNWKVLWFCGAIDISISGNIIWKTAYVKAFTFPLLSKGSSASLRILSRNYCFRVMKQMQYCVLTHHNHKHTTTTYYYYYYRRLILLLTLPILLHVSVVRPSSGRKYIIS
jgi:hypothetical protein